MPLQPPWYKRELTGRRLVWNILFYVGHVAIFAYAGVGLSGLALPTLLSGWFARSVCAFSFVSLGSPQGLSNLPRLVAPQIRARRATKIVGVLMHPSGAMEIRFVKPSMKYKAGQWLFVNVPEVSRFEWHPFTISSAPDDPYTTVHVRRVGDWTSALADRLGCTSSVAAQSTKSASGDDEKMYGEAAFIDVSQALAAAGKMPTLRIDGPFGAPAEDVFKHEGALTFGSVALSQPN
ncbi:hypothetical protein P7C70_g1970, partial [Phenoliferia sp. Uapishka_3]